MPFPPPPWGSTGSTLDAGAHLGRCCSSAEEPDVPPFQNLYINYSMAAQGWVSPHTPKVASAAPPPGELGMGCRGKEEKFTKKNHCKEEVPENPEPHPQPVWLSSEEWGLPHSESETTSVVQLYNLRKGTKSLSAPVP